jgi:hypothetical protein
MKLTLGSQNLNAYMILSYVVVVLLTAIAVGIPAILLIQAQLERQAWSQVVQGHWASEALYAAKMQELADLATLTAQRPTLSSLLEAGDTTELKDYLDTLRTGVELDFIMICAPENTAIAASGEVIPPDACTEFKNSGYLLMKGAVPQVFLTSGRQIIQEDGSWVVVGLQLDNSFAGTIRAETPGYIIGWMVRPSPPALT